MDGLQIRGRNLADFAYRYAPGLWVVTAYYNPVGYNTRRANYEAFAWLLRRSGIPLLTVECAFGDQPFDLPNSADVVRVRSESMLWQKERLLNLAISWLPSSCQAVAWLDCDLVFADPDWAVETLARLRDASVVQVFETCDRLPRDYKAPPAEGKRCLSFTDVVGRDPTTLRAARFEEHGHTGYGWAARKDILDRHGLYEYAVAGSADHFMAHAAVGDLDSRCVRDMLRTPAMIRHFREWAEPFHATVRGGIGTVPGEVLHLWHGELADRKYQLRHIELADLNFDPYRDLIAAPGKPLELRPGTGREGLAEWFRSYFTARREDGVRLAA